MGDKMDFDVVIKNRRSIRKYSNQNIPITAINQIIEAGLLAPSAHNRQPWEIVVLKKKQTEIAAIMKQYNSIHPEDESILKTASTIERCNTLLLVYCNSFEQWEYDLLSMGAMIENMLLKATDLEIGSVWIGNVVPMQKEISNYLKIDDRNKKLVSAVALGYSLHEPKPLSRKKLLDIVLYQDFMIDEE